MRANLTNQIESILRKTEDENEIVLQINQLLSEYNNPQITIKDSKSISKLVAEKSEIMQHPDVNQRFLKTGFKDYDNGFGGLLLGEFVVIAGRPCMGKNQFLVNISINVSRNTPVLFLSLGLNESRLTTKFISTISGITTHKLLEMNFSKIDRNHIDEAGKDLGELNLFINDDSSISLSNFKSICKKHIEEDGVKVIVVDELQLMCSTHKDRISRDLEISSITRELKNIAKDFDVCVIAGSQLNRNGESRNGLNCKRPHLSDLRESGSIEYYADKVILLHRSEYYGFIEDGMGTSLIGLAELIVAKNKVGPICEIMIRKNTNFTSFFDADYNVNLESCFIRNRLN